MKNKTFLSTLLIITAFIFASCGTGRPGYGCPSTVTIQKPSVEKNKV